MEDRHAEEQVQDHQPPQEELVPPDQRPPPLPRRDRVPLQQLNYLRIPQQFKK